MWHDEINVKETDPAVAYKAIGAETWDRKVPGGYCMCAVTRWGSTLGVGGKAIELHLIEDKS